jgi:hypothetical protein
LIINEKFEKKLNHEIEEKEKEKRKTPLSWSGHLLLFSLKLFLLGNFNYISSLSFWMFPFLLGPSIFFL